MSNPEEIRGEQDQVEAWLEGLSQEDREMFGSDSAASLVARAVSGREQANRIAEEQIGRTDLGGPEELSL